MQGQLGYSKCVLHISVHNNFQDIVLLPEVFMIAALNQNTKESFLSSPTEVDSNVYRLEGNSRAVARDWSGFKS